MESRCLRRASADLVACCLISGFTLCLLLSVFALLYHRRSRQGKGQRKESGDAEQVASPESPTLTGLAVQNGNVALQPTPFDHVSKPRALPGATGLDKINAFHACEKGHPFQSRESGMTEVQQDDTLSSPTDSSSSFAKFMQRSSPPPMLPSLQSSPPNLTTAARPLYIDNQRQLAMRADSMGNVKPPVTVALPEPRLNSQEATAPARRVPYDQWRFGL